MKNNGDKEAPSEFGISFQSSLPPFPVYCCPITFSSGFTFLFIISFEEAWLCVQNRFTSPSLYLASEWTRGTQRFLVLCKFLEAVCRVNRTRYQG